MSKKRQMRVHVIALDAAGNGEATVEDLLLKIPGAAIGDDVTVVLEHKSHHTSQVWCRVAHVHTRGEDFEPPVCSHAWPVAGRCGGCPLMHLAQRGTDVLKRQAVESALLEKKIEAAVLWHPSQSQFAYRNRGQFVVSRRKKGVILGAYAPRSHEVVSMAKCKVLRPPIAEVAAAISLEIEKCGLAVYPEEGGVRYVTLRGSTSGEVLIDLVGAGPCREEIQRFAKTIMSLDAVVGVAYSENNNPGNAIRVAPSIFLAGQETIVEPVGDLHISLAAASFSQLNLDVMTAMYQQAAAIIAPDIEVLWDLYCGVGGLGLTVARATGPRQLYGADSVPEAMELARTNAAAAKVDATYQAFDLSTSFPAAWPKPDGVIVNPPRRGLDPLVLEQLMKIQPNVIVYMSCNPKTFAADAAVLINAGYRLQEVDAYDMLPQTVHVEVIAGFHLEGTT